MQSALYLLVDKIYANRLWRVLFENVTSLRVKLARSELPSILVRTASVLDSPHWIAQKGIKGQNSFSG